MPPINEKDCGPSAKLQKMHNAEMKRNSPLSVTIDPEHLRRRLEQRLDELGKTARGASREADLGESTIRNIMEGKSKSPRLQTIMRLAEVLEVNPDWFIPSLKSEKNEEGEDFITSLLKNQSELLRRSEPNFKPQDVEVEKFHLSFMGSSTAQGAELLRLNREFIETSAFSNRHDLLYIVVLNDDLMWPVFRKLDFLLVDPTKSLVKDEDYIFIWPVDGEKLLAKVGRLTEFDEATFLIDCFNPAFQERLLRREWTEAHRIVSRSPTISSR